MFPGLAVEQTVDFPWFETPWRWCDVTVLSTLSFVSSFSVWRQLAPPELRILPDDHIPWLAVHVSTYPLPDPQVHTYSALSIYRGHFSSDNSRKSPHISPVRARYDVVRECKSDRSFHHCNCCAVYTIYNRKISRVYSNVSIKCEVLKRCCSKCVDDFFNSRISNVVSTGGINPLVPVRKWL